MKKIVVLILVFSALVPVFANELVKIDVVDDLGYPTGESYITFSEDLSGTYNKGFFSNGNLLWNIKIDVPTGEVIFILKEDGQDKDFSNSTDTSGDSLEYEITFSLKNGTTQTVEGKLVMSETSHMNNVTADWNCFDLFTSNNCLSVSIKSKSGSYSLGEIEFIGLENLAFSDELYSRALLLMTSGRWEKAISVFETYKIRNIDAYSFLGCDALIEQCKLELTKENYNKAKELMGEEKYFEAIELLRLCGDYSYAKDFLEKCKQLAGVYDVGDVGPAGGYVFYDCDADNKSGNADGLISTECGWRYLEAAPEDLSGRYRFGYYIAEGDKYCSAVGGTSTAIGTGKANTEALVKAMGNETYTGDLYPEKGIYAAKACADYSITVDGIVYDDWFLPSKDELNLLYENLFSKNLGAFRHDYYSSYWSSSEYTRSPSDSNSRAWVHNFSNDYQCDSYRYLDDRVRPIRAFI